MNRYALTLAGLRAAKYLTGGLALGLSLATLHAYFPATRHSLAFTVALGALSGLLNYYVRQWAEQHIKLLQQANTARLIP